MQNPSLEFDSDIFYLTGIPRPSLFEEAYVSLRKKENRLYGDEIVRDLPEIPHTHPLMGEWSLRTKSLVKLVAHLRKRSTSKVILEIGCGNGWLSHRLSQELAAEVCAMDVNETELRQGARVFGGDTRVCFLFADVFSLPDEFVSFDTIVLASSIQYFPDLNKLVKRLFTMLAANGEIHILDSPLYKSHKAAILGRKRSMTHFSAMGHPEMYDHYFHHVMDEIGDFNLSVLYNPSSLTSLINRNLLGISDGIFPWIIIRKE